ncbi:carbohydrate ABC transporter permease [Calidifontibacter indicus]|uniref:Carbohydrate ABC transporter membrane protein 1 (CUT1 family) n=1 Tax=Calidifontibacter indicus TaxID=419650 RepID=A0A3D9V1I7_9MICO|nr:sugar ABC transporter permease [Calidifontibacter indicus]REF32034.1 carbohydrate ABC transporter membrane protein 1 (CUT1 family) [Calidifontibacter indicus]
MSTAAPATATETRPTKKAALSDRAKGERSLGWKLAGPAFVVMLLVTLYPIGYAIYLSLFNYRLTDPAGRKFVGLQNYITALGDPLFHEAFMTTIFIVVVTLIFELVIGFGIALLMNKVVIPRRTLRTVVLIPYSIITVVSAFAWLYAAQPDTGFINHWLHTLSFGAWNENYDWFGGRWSSLFIICLSEIWKTTPFMSLLLLAGLAQVDGSMEEAAKVDGATWWQRLTKVVLPNMKAAIMVATLFRTLDAVRIYDNPYVMTGGANKTNSLSMLVGQETVGRVEIGMGSALAVLLFLLVLIIAGIFVKGFKVDLTGGGRS